MKLFALLFILIMSTALFSNKPLTELSSSADSVLFIDVTGSNLPVPSVTGAGMDVASADFDGDNDLDIVIAREFTPNVLLLNDGHGTFVNGTTGRLPQFNYDSEDIGIADFDRNGYPDIVFASEDNAVHEFYLNNGNAVFSNFNNRLPSSISNALLVIDLDMDNYPDLIFGNSGPGNPATPAEARVLINNRDTTFRDETVIRFPPNTLMIPQDIKAGDLDNDGDPDLVFGNETGNKILINNGSGVFSDETSARIPLYGNEETRKVTLSDIDHDKDLDIFFANVAFRSGMNSQDRLLINDGKGFFTDETPTRIPFDNEHTTEGIFLDADLDGDPDLITANVFVNRPVKIFTNDGNGFFEERTSVLFPPGTVAEGLGIEASDFNNDGLKDIYIVHRRTAQSLGNDRLLLRKDTATSNIYTVQENVLNNFILYQNFPNPFNPSTTISYYVPVQSKISISVFNISGKEVIKLFDGISNEGSYSVRFDGTVVPSGIYFYKLSTPGNVIVKKMIILK